MKKSEQEKLLNLLNEKAKLKDQYAELDKQILRLAHDIGPNSICIEVDASMKKAYSGLKIADDQQYFRMSLVDNMDFFAINESDDEMPTPIFRPAKFSRFEIEGKALKRKPKDMD
jgi:hypothetical protein